MGADSILVGNMLAGLAITIGTSGMIVGRAIAQIAVTCETACTVVKCVDDIQCDNDSFQNGPEACFSNVCQPDV